MFYAFAVFSLVVMGGAFNGFRHQVKSHQEPQVVLQEDSTLKAKGIRLPGYNR